MTFDASGMQKNSTLAITNGLVTADPPTVKRRQALWDVGAAPPPPRVYAQAFRFNLDAAAANAGLTAGRGRTVLVRSRLDDGGVSCALVWHLDTDLEQPPLVRTLGVRLPPDSHDERQVLALDGSVHVALDLLLWVAAKHRLWVLSRLPAKDAARAAGLGVVHIDVEGRPDRETYLRGLFGERVATRSKTASGVLLLRLSP